MTPRKDLAELAATALARDSGEGVPRSDLEEARVIATVAAAIRARRVEGMRRRWLLGSFAAAATIALGLGIAKRGAQTLASIHPAPTMSSRPDVSAASATVDQVTGEAYILHGSASQSVVPGRAVGAGDQILVEHGAGVTLGLPSGTRVVAEEGADLTVLAEGATQLFRLTAGSMRANVHKLAPGERFMIRTSDAEVEVRGTAFRVSTVTAADASCGGGTTTRVAVEEGVVTVRSGHTEASVPAGHMWPECGMPVAAPSRNALPSAMAADTRLMPSTPSRMALPKSDLAEQNDLYASAIAARDKGDTVAAVARFERLVAKYPLSPLAENAYAERMKVLATSDPLRAVEAARDYLATYPSGAARADAEAVLARSGSR
jgi:hypothetical protein